MKLDKWEEFKENTMVIASLLNQNEVPSTTTQKLMLKHHKIAQDIVDNIPKFGLGLKIQSHVKTGFLAYSRCAHKWLEQNRDEKLFGILNDIDQEMKDTLD